MGNEHLKVGDIYVERYNLFTQAASNMRITEGSPTDPITIDPVDISKLRTLRQPDLMELFDTATRRYEQLNLKLVVVDAKWQALSARQKTVIASVKLAIASTPKKYPNQDARSAALETHPDVITARADALFYRSAKDSVEAAIAIVRKKMDRINDRLNYLRFPPGRAGAGDSRTPRSPRHRNSKGGHPSHTSKR